MRLPFDMVKAGLHCDRRMSKQILPLLFMLGWYILVVNETWGMQISVLHDQVRLELRYKLYQTENWSVSQMLIA